MGLAVRWRNHRILWFATKLRLTFILKRCQDSPFMFPELWQPAGDNILLPSDVNGSLGREGDAQPSFRRLCQ